MPLVEEMEASGGWLFRWRSYLPLLTLPFYVLALPHATFFSGEAVLTWKLFCLAVAFLGLLARGIVAGYKLPGTSGRNTRSQAADNLNTTEMYSIVRHPLYLGNLVIWLGVSMFLGVWWLVVINTLVFYIYYERIAFTEEAFLRRKFGGTYVEWASRTPAYLPRFSQWTAREGAFSIRKAITSEYHGVLAITAIICVLEIAGHAYLNGAFRFDPVWRWVLLCSVTFYLCVRFLTKAAKRRRVNTA